MSEHKIYQAMVSCQIKYLRVIRDGHTKNGKRYLSVCLFNPDPNNAFSTQDAIWATIWITDKTNLMNEIEEKDVIALDGTLSIATSMYRGDKQVKVNIFASTIEKMEVNKKKDSGIQQEYHRKDNIDIEQEEDLPF